MTPRILIVEDDDALRTAVQAILERSGYDAGAAPHGSAAIRALQNGAYDVVLLDIGLPFVDGWRILRSLEAGRMPSVIVISARGEERDKVRALDLGADDYLAKPFGANELLARIRAVLRRVNPDAVAAPALHLDDVVIDLGRRTVLKGGHEVRLSPTRGGLHRRPDGHGQQGQADARRRSPAAQRGHHGAGHAAPAVASERGRERVAPDRPAPGQAGGRGRVHEHGRRVRARRPAARRPAAADSPANGPEARRAGAGAAGGAASAGPRDAA